MSLHRIGDISKNLGISITFLLEMATWPCQVKECKMILEQILLTDWLASYRNCQPHFQFHQAKSSRTLEWSWDLLSWVVRWTKVPIMYADQWDAPAMPLLLLEHNLVPRVVSELLFQSSSRKTTLVQGVVFDGEFDLIAMKFWMAVKVWFQFIVISTLFLILCWYGNLAASAGCRKDPRLLFSESLLKWGQCLCLGTDKGNQ